MLASKMTPKPDHVETPYKVSGRLAGCTALITGGDSGMYRAAAITLARVGADVAIKYLPADEPDAQQIIQLIRAFGRPLAQVNRRYVPGLCSTGVAVRRPFENGRKYSSGEQRLQTANS